MREGAFRSPLHDERTASLIGTALGIAFSTAFVTGVISHELQHPPSWLPLPTRPVWFYRFTQGLHVASGIAAIPLLLAKLWTVYPRLYSWPPVKSLIHALERLSIAVLVAGAVFELATGLLNIVQWYPWKFAFTQTHFWVAWITFGALVLHVAVKAPAIARGLRRRRSGADGDEVGTAASAEAEETASASASASALHEPLPTHLLSAPLPSAQPSSTPAESAPSPAGASRDFVSRRALLTATGIAVGVVTATTIGASVTSLRSIDLLAPRSPEVGPQGVPINRTAAQARVMKAALDPGWRLTVEGPDSVELSLAQLAALPQHSASLPIACVEGWSVNAQWEGVRLADLLDRVGASPDSNVRISSLERGGAYAVTVMPHEYTRDPLTLLALRLNGSQLDIDHGYPARIIAPARPGVLQTKWVSRIEVL
jgi:hypothetical protein